MSEHDGGPILSRRELRLREAAEAAAQAENDLEQAEGEVAQEADEQPVVPEEALERIAQIDIPVVDEHGNPRSRREIRDLYAQAEAEILAEYATVEAEVEEVTEAVEPEVSVEEETLVEDESSAEEEAHVEDEASVEEEPLVEEEASVEVEIPVEEEASVEVEIPVEEEAPVEEATPAEEDAPVAEEAPAEEELPAEEDAPAELVEVQETDEPGEADTVEAELVEIAPSDQIDEELPEPVSAQPSSFPDIAPLDDIQSVFDDPAVRVSGGVKEAETDGDFDSLIDRVVAQEGAAGTTNSSALILPSMPEAGELAGPLGATGELFITGSIGLPKSLGETGGVPAMHRDSDLLEELGFSDTEATGGVMAPVSASRAVSAQSASEAAMAELASEKSKLPVIFMSVGGVLVVGAIGLVIWALNTVAG